MTVAPELAHSSRNCWWTIERELIENPNMATSPYRAGLHGPSLGPPRQNDRFFGHYAVSIIVMNAPRELGRNQVDHFMLGAEFLLPACLLSLARRGYFRIHVDVVAWPTELHQYRASSSAQTSGQNFGERQLYTGGDGIVELLGYYGSAFAAADSVYMRTTGWDGWDRRKRIDAPPTLLLWSRKLVK